MRVAVVRSTMLVIMLMVSMAKMNMGPLRMARSRTRRILSMKMRHHRQLSGDVDHHQQCSGSTAKHEFLGHFLRNYRAVNAQQQLRKWLLWQSQPGLSVNSALAGYSSKACRFRNRSSESRADAIRHQFSQNNSFMPDQSNGVFRMIVRRKSLLSERRRLRVSSLKCEASSLNKPPATSGASP